MKNKNFRFAFEIILTLIIFMFLAIANILSGARTTAKVEQEIAQARNLTETTAPAILGVEAEDETLAAKRP